MQFILKFSLFKLLFRSQVVGVATFLLSAVGGSDMQARVTLSTNHFLAVVFLRKFHERRFNNATSQSQDEMQSRF